MPVDIRIRFGRAVRRIREEQEINQEEAAERCGLHRTYYSCIERGIRNVSLVNLEKIAKGLKKSLPGSIRARLKAVQPLSEQHGTAERHVTLRSPSNDSRSTRKQVCPACVAIRIAGRCYPLKQFAGC